MLRNRSRKVTTKQAVMGDKNSFFSSSKNTATRISSFLGSPRFFFSGFSSRTIYDTETAANAISPTSILDNKNSSNFVNPFGYDKNLSKPPTEIISKQYSCTNKRETEAIGLALVHSINEEKADEKFSRMVLFGAKLKVQIPTLNSPADFGIKTRDSHLFSATPPKDYYTRQLSLKEMELSEDYTCVITHDGPNKKTTHIFDNCIVENCCQDNNKIETAANVSFLSYCHTCKASLQLGKDIYMYRGEKAFCSHECRFQEMLSEGMKNPEMDDYPF